MNAWIKDGAEPPESQYPRIDRGEAAPFETFPFPRMPGVELPRHILHAYHLDFGPEFETAGIMSVEPPKIGKPFPQLVSKVGIEDGNEVAGIRSVDLQVPLATYTGWNLRSADIGAPDRLADMIGSFIPYAKTKAERTRTQDPRPSIEERYTGREDYLSKVKDAADGLVRRRFLLEADVPRVVEAAGARWDLVTK